jgi:hypothetical protein
MDVHVELGIPDDTPENTVKNIDLIANEVAREFPGAKVSRTLERKGLSTNFCLRVEFLRRQFHIDLHYVESQNLNRGAGTIGNGFMFTGTETWKLELLPMDWRHHPSSPPFRWALYPKDTVGIRHTEPSHVLDGSLRRRMMRDSLSPPPLELL